MNNQFINIRVQSVSQEDNEELIKHCLRMKKEKRAINDNDNSYIDNQGHKVLFSRNDYKNNNNAAYISGRKLLEENKNIVKKQKAILKQNGKYLNKKRTNSILSGVITFSDSIKNFNEAQLNELETAAQKCIYEICQKYNTEAHYIVFHKDEQGLPHFHFSVDNFDNTTGLTFSKSKNFGSDLQDIAAKYFSRFGFNRGIKKENNFNRKHLSIEEFKEYQDTKKANKELISANNELIKENKELKNEINNLREEFYQIISDIEEFATEEDKSQKTKKWLKLWERYSKSGNVEKRDKLLKKAQKYKEKITKLKI